MVLLAGCGSAHSGNAGHAGHAGGGGPVRAWCPAIAGLTSARATDLTGKADTYRRVAAVNARYGPEVLRKCHGVVSVGVSTVGCVRPQSHTCTPATRTESDYVLAVGVKTRADLPPGPLFLHGVRLVFQVTGPITLADAAGTSRSHLRTRPVRR